MENICSPLLNGPVLLHGTCWPGDIDKPGEFPPCNLTAPHSMLCYPFTPQGMQSPTATFVPSSNLTGIPLPIAVFHQPANSLPHNLYSNDPIALPQSAAVIYTGKEPISSHHDIPKYQQDHLNCSFGVFSPRTSAQYSPHTHCCLDCRTILALKGRSRPQISSCMFEPCTRSPRWGSRHLKAWYSLNTLNYRETCVFTPLLDVANSIGLVLAYWVCESIALFCSLISSV